VVDLGECEVTFVFGGDGHDRPGAVAHEHVVGHVDRHEVTGERVDDPAAGEGSTLLERPTVGRGRPLDLGARGGPPPKLVHDLALCGDSQRVDEGVLGRHDRIGHPEARVRSRREDPQRDSLGAIRSVTTLDDKIELRALGTSDPIALHGLDPLGPIEVVERSEELLCVCGDLEEPLLEVPALHDVSGALAGPIGEHLLVGEHRPATRAPVDRGRVPVGEAGIEECQEDRLGPSHVLDVVTRDLPAPVVDGTEPEQRLTQLGNSGIGESPRVRPGLYRRVLRGQPEGVKPDR
jgi:hypothetical protein